MKNVLFDFRKKKVQAENALIALYSQSKITYLCTKLFSAAGRQNAEVAAYTQSKIAYEEL
jgi:hypothetical protein